MNSIAIDFGTTRTKVARLDPASGQARLVEIGTHIRTVIPSLFYVPLEGSVLVGDVAFDFLEEDPAGIVRGLKKRIHEEKIRKNRRSFTPVELAAELFREIREQCEHSVFHAPVTGCTLTVPVAFDPLQRERICDAARAGGFAEVNTIDEPVAAARHWLASQQPGGGQFVVVCDIGGGTTDIALLSRTENGFQTFPEVPPSGFQKGGNNIDDHLFGELLEGEDESSPLYHKDGFRVLVQRTRERFARDRRTEIPLKIGEHRLILTRAQVEACSNRFVEELLSELTRFRESMKRAKVEKVPLLMIGGGMHTLGLREALERSWDAPVIGWEDSEYATVLGALAKHPAAPEQIKSLPSAPISKPVHATERIKPPSPAAISKPVHAPEQTKSPSPAAISKPVHAPERIKSPPPSPISNPVHGNALKVGLIRVFSGHSGDIKSVTFSPNGRLALSGGADNTLRLWDVESGKEIRCFRGHKDGWWDHGEVNSVSFSPDSRRALSGGNDRTVRLWDVRSGKKIRCLRGHSGLVKAVSFSPDGRRALSGANDMTARLWDVESGHELKQLERQGFSMRVVGALFSKDGSRALLAEEHRLHLWDVESGAALYTWAYEETVHSVAFSPDGSQALCGISEKALRLLDLETGKFIRSYVGHTKVVNSVAFSPDGRRALSGSDDKTLRLWDIENGKELCRFGVPLGPVCSMNGAHLGPVRSVAFSPDGMRAMSGGDNHSLRAMLFGRGDSSMRLWQLPP